MAELLGFLVVAAVVICTPGPDTALTIRNALVGGRRSGVATALGVALGQATWTVAAAFGVVALVHASQTAFSVLKLLGAAYLVYLGLQALAAAVRGKHRPGPVRARAGVRPRVALRQGLVSNLANPKMVVFFTSLLPQFGDGFVQLLSLGLAFSLLTFLWLAAYGAAVARARRLLDRDRVRRVIDAASGVVLVSLGLRLALERR